MDSINNSQRSKKSRRRRKRGKQKQPVADSSVLGSRVGAFKTTPSPQVQSKPCLGKPVTPSHTKKRPLESVQRPGSASRNKLSAMQMKMKQRLEGGQFRILNEELYTTSGNEAFRKFQRDPKLFDVYHRGFREQVEKWPVNPLDVFINYVAEKKNAVVADFGCGDAVLAQSVPNKVYSFDLVSVNDFVTACDMSKVPLPDASVDIAVFCLSLMGTTIAKFISEAHRVLKNGGVMKVAEVKSRFEGDTEDSLEQFLKKVELLGFKFISKDMRNKMFVLMEFRKQKGSKPDRNVTISLKPCIYKRR